MVDVLGLHGIGQQQRGRLQMQPDWQAALRDGVERAKGLAWPKPSLDLAYYGDVFLADTDNTMGKGGLQVPEVLDADVVAFLEQLQDEIVDSSQPLDVQEPTKGLAKGLPAPLTPLAAWLERRFGLAGKLLFFGDLVQVRRFQRDDELAETVLDRVREMLPQNPRVLAGHSLGSIVAYEALCRIPDHGVTTLITLGSPLGLRSIRQGMHGRPGTGCPTFRLASCAGSTSMTPATPSPSPVGWPHIGRWSRTRTSTTGTNRTRSRTTSARR